MGRINSVLFMAFKSILLIGVTASFCSCQTTDKEEQEAVDEANRSELIDDCSGDFDALQNDLTSVFINNIKNGSLQIGATTKEDVKGMIGDAEAFNKDYSGLIVSGHFIYDQNAILQSITLEYFYKCEDSFESLSIDKAAITSLISSALNTEGSCSGNYEDAGISWDVRNMIIRQANFTDGYGIYLDAMN